MNNHVMTGILAAVVVCALLSLFYNIGAWSTQKEIKRTCERYEVVDLYFVGAMFYCSREKK